MPGPTGKQRLIDAAERLFGREGFKGVSVDQLLEEAGVARRTLYKAYAGKSKLTQSSLAHRDRMLRAHVMQWLDGLDEASAKDRILAVFDATADWSNRQPSNGCFFVSALSEFGGSGSVEEAVARQHKREMLDQMTTLCHALACTHPETLARDLRLLLEGASVARLTLDDTEAFGRARKIASLLCDRAVKSEA